MLELTHSVISHVGLAGLAAIWVIKAGASFLGLRWLRQRRLGTRG